MTEIRDTRAVAEAAGEGPVEVNDTRAVVEAVGEGPVEVNDTRAVVEAIGEGPVEVNVTRGFLEVLADPHISASASDTITLTDGVVVDFTAGVQTRQVDDSVATTDSVQAQVSQFTMGIPQTQQAWPLFTAPLTPQLPTSPPDDTGFDATVGTPALGFGLLRPFRRDQKQDWASATGARLIRSAVAQVLGTNATGPIAQGELPWRPEFGSQLYRLRMGLTNAEAAVVARKYVADAIARWEPRIRITRVHTSRRSVPPGILNAMVIVVFYDIVGNNPQNTQVLGSGSTEVPIPTIATE